MVRLVKLGGVGWWKDHRGEVPSTSHHIGVCDSYMTLLVMVTFITWLRRCFPGFSTVKLVLFPFLYFILWEKAIVSSPPSVQNQQEGRKIKLHLLKEYLHILNRIL